MTDFTTRVRRKTSAQWAASALVLALDEPGLDTDSGRFKLGDGVNVWSALPQQGPVVVVRTAAYLAANATLPDVPVNALVVITP